MKFPLQTSLFYILQTAVYIHIILTYFKVHIQLIYYNQAIIILFILKSSLTFSILCDHVICDITLIMKNKCKIK